MTQSDPSISEFRVLRPYEYHCQLASRGVRADGRKLEEMRELRLETDAVKTADSSSLVKLGNTSLVCGCTAKKVNISERVDDIDDITIKVEMPPICSGPTGYKSYNIAPLITKTVKAIINDTGCIDRGCLHYEEDDSYISVAVEVICLNYDGSLLDSTLIAILTALRTLRIKNLPNDRIGGKSLVKKIPICMSFALIGDHLIRDPSIEEETIANSTFSITIDTSEEKSYHITKTGGKPISYNQFLRCLRIARNGAQEIQNQISSEIAKDVIRMDCGQ